MRTQNTSFWFYNWILENEGHVENEGVIWKDFQKESVLLLGVLRTHRHIMIFPEVISARKTEQLLEECEGYHAKHVYVVQVRGNDGRSQSSGGTSLLNILTSITLAQSHISPDHCQKNQEYYQCKKKISSKLISHKINTHVVTMCNFTN